MNSFYKVQQGDYQNRMFDKKYKLKSNARNALDRGLICRDIYNCVMDYVDDRISEGEYLLLTKSLIAVKKGEQNG